MKHKNQTMMIVTTIGLLVAACNSGAGVASTTTTPAPDSVNNPDGSPSHHQTASILLQADSSVDLNNNSVQNLTPEIKPNSQMGQWSGSSLGGESSAYGSNWSFDNTSLNFRVIINGAKPIMSTWDDGCQSTPWVSPNNQQSGIATANFVCYNSSNPDILKNTTPQSVDTCQLYTGTPPTDPNNIGGYNYTMTTPRYSNPTAYVYLSENNGVFHFSCTYSWYEYSGI